MKLSFFWISCFYYCNLFGAGAPTGTIARAISITVTTVNNTCQKHNGKIIVQASGGVLPYTYSISGPFAPQPSGVFYNLPPGNYTVTARDALLDEATQNVTLTNTLTAPVARAISYTPPGGCNSYDATLTLGATGGLPPYTYSLDNINYQTGNVFTNLTAGTYFYFVKDANGCNSLPPVLLNPSVVIRGNCSIELSNWSGGFSCNPKQVSISLTGVSGGTPPYTYSSDGINYQTSKIMENLTDGIFTFRIKDATGLIFLYSISFFDDCPTPFSVGTMVQKAQCAQNGSITITAANGNPPYRYSLDGINFQTANLFSGLSPGLYTITVKDAVNLLASKLVQVPDNCAVVTAVTNNSTCGLNNGKIEALASNGTAPYLFSLDGINYAANNIFTNLAASGYRLYTKDATGGIGTANLIISNIEGPKITAINTTEAGCDNRAGSITATAGNGNAPLLYRINSNNFQSNPVFTGLPAGNYTLTVKDTNNCTDSKTVIITPGNNIPVVNLGKDTTLCEGQTLVLNTANPNAAYLWQDGSTKPVFRVTKKGLYHVSVNIAGCIRKDTISVDYELIPAFTLGADKKICLENKNILKPIITDNVPLQDLHYLWQDGSTDPVYKLSKEGIYKLTLSNQCGFTADDIQISKGICDIYVPNTFTPNGDSKNDIFKIGYGDQVTGFEMEVFNRYGQPVFKTTDKNKGWDGNVQAKPQLPGTYAWVIRYTTITDNRLQEMHGTIMLLR